MSDHPNPPVSTEELERCPFCGGDAEMDSRRAYCSYPEGKRGSAVAIYCLKCGADMSLCREDYRGMDDEELIYLVRKQWNNRPAELTRLQSLLRQSQEENGRLREAFVGETSMLRAVRYSIDHADKPFPSMEKINTHIERLENALHTKGNYDT